MPLELLRLSVDRNDPELYRHEGIGFNIPESWKQPLKLGQRGRIEALTAGWMAVTIWTTDDRIERAVDFAWGSGPRQHHQMDWQCEINSGRYYLLYVFRPNQKLVNIDVALRPI